MSALENTSYGTFWLYLVGIIFIVIGGLGISMIRDGLITVGEKNLSNDDVRNQILEGNRRIIELNETAEKLQKSQDVNNIRHAADNQRKLLQSRLDKIKVEIPQLEKDLVTEKETKVDLVEEHRLYRKRTRAILWARAEKRKLGDIINPTGGFYENASIIKVDAAGITIRHDSGTGRLSIYQLSEAHLKEFDLSTVEAEELRISRLKAEAARNKEIERKLLLQKRGIGTGSGKDVEKFFKPEK